MTKKEIIDHMAWRQMVENVIIDMTHYPLSYDYEDLAQMIYLALMEQPDERVINLWNDGEMYFFVRGIVRNQLFSKTSPFYLTVRKFSAITDDIDGCYDTDTHKQDYERGEDTCE